MMDGLSPGESVPVVVELRTDDLRSGRHDILVGASSRDPWLRGTVEL